MQLINFQCSYKQQLSSRSQEVDSVVLELKGQMAELNEQLSQRSKSLENELAKREQQVYNCIYSCICMCRPYFLCSRQQEFIKINELLMATILSDCFIRVFVCFCLLYC